MDKMPYKDPHETSLPMSGMEKVHYISMRAVTPNWSMAVCQLWDCSKLLALLKERKEAGHRITFAALMIKLMAAAIERNPKMGWMVRRWRWIKPSTADIGCSVATGATGATVAPLVVIRDAARKTVEQINEELAELAAEARASEDREQEWINKRVHWIPGSLLSFLLRILLTRQKFVRTITGNFGISITDPLLGAHLAITGATCVNTMIIGPIKEHALVEDGNIVVRPAAWFTLHFQHGILGAQDVWEFLDECARLIRNPEEVS